MAPYPVTKEKDHEKIKQSNLVNSTMRVLSKRMPPRYVTPKNPFKPGDVVGNSSTKQVGEVVSVFGKWVKFRVHGTHRTVRFSHRKLELVMSYNDRVRMAHYLHKKHMNNQGKRGIVGKVAAWVRNLVKQPKPALAE